MKTQRPIPPARDTSPARRVLAVVLLAGVATGALVPVAAHTTPPSKQVSMSGADALTLAQRLFERGKLDEAQAVLSSLRTSDPDKVDHYQVAFLTGMIAAKRGDYEDAEEIFRKILSDKPQLVRVRLELAKVLFERRRDQAAAYHFRLALANGLPEETQKVIRQYLGKIEERKVFHVSFSAGLAPSTNINNGTQDRFVDINGLVLPVADDSTLREKSGTGLTSSLSLSALPRLSRRWRMENRFRVSARDFSQVTFDDVNTGLETGLRYQGKRLATGILLTGSKRWFGGTDYSESYGARLELTTPLSRRTRFRTRLSLSEVTYDSGLDNGPVYTVGMSVSHALDRRTFLTADTEIIRVQSDIVGSRNMRNTQYQIATSFQRELPFGITGQVQPLVYYRKFDEEDPIFPQVREDTAYSLSFHITKRDWHFRGFAPAFGYSYLNSQSNIDFYSYEQHRLDIGVTRNF